ncbi:MAG: hypothetical protein IRZ14_14885 [Chloroflexi bacterium]|nr:hypothetical protein [Chloroflexota bacterium]
MDAPADSDAVLAARYAALPCGVLVHDASGHLRYASPAASALLGLAADELRTLSATALCERLTPVDTEGAPLTPERLPWEQARRSAAQPRTTVLGVQPVAGQRRWLAVSVARVGAAEAEEPTIAVLIDISALAARAELAGRMLDALPIQIALLDAAGRIVGVSEGWRRFATHFARDATLVDPIGADYLAVCDAAVGADAERARAVAEGIRAVLDGRAPFLVFEYPCNLPTGARWFFMYVAPGRAGGAVVAHVDITASHRAQVLEAEARLQRTRRIERAREQRALAYLAGADAEAADRPPSRLADTDPRLFATLVARYGELLDLAVEQRTFQVQHGLADALREVAERIAAQDRGARDGIALHLAALESRLAGQPEERAQVYVEESRLVLVELLTHLADWYRQHGAPPGAAPSAPGWS